MKRNIAIILIILSSSGYSQWFPQNSSIQNELSKIFIFGNTGYSTSINTGTAIQKTTNAGDSWLLSGNFGAVVTTLYFLNNFTGFVVSLDGFTHKTTNGGSSWEVYQTAVPYTRFSSLYYINENIGFRGGVGNFTSAFWMTINKTTNGGVNWIQTFYTGESAVIFDFCFINNTMYASGDHHLLKSSDLGNSWFSILPSGFGYFKSLYFFDNNSGFVTSGGNILKTTNGGINWFAENLNSNYFLNDIYFISNRLYVVGDASRIFVSTDMGSQWGTQSVNSSGDLNDVSFMNSTTGFIVGGTSVSGSILKTTNAGGNITKVIALSLDIPLHYSLSQNYPNPFNPQTKIKFDIPVNVKGQTSNVKLVIYDLLGREVTTLVNEELKPGTYETDWDASNFSSGVYFYKIISEGFVETKKMALMK